MATPPLKGGMSLLRTFGEYGSCLRREKVTSWGSPLNRTMTFELFDFLSNRFPRSAARDSGTASRRPVFLGPENETALEFIASITTPEWDHGPLTLVGPSGAGKTTILQTLAAFWKGQGKDSSVLYIHGRDFAQAFSDAQVTNSVRDFRQRFRRHGLVLIDDLEDVATRPAAAEELCSTLDDYVGESFKLIASCELAPKPNSRLDDRLKSRLTSGVIAPIEKASLETATALVQSLASGMKHGPSEEAMAHWIQVHLSGRKGGVYPGALVSLWEATKKEAKSLNRTMQAHILETSAAETAPSKSKLAKLTRLVAKHWGVTTQDLLGPSRQRSLAHARGVAMLLARETTDLSLSAIAKHFGRRDHTTVLHACRKTEELVRDDRETREAMEELRESLHDRKDPVSSTKKRGRVSRIG